MGSASATCSTFPLTSVCPYPCRRQSGSRSGLEGQRDALTADDLVPRPAFRRCPTDTRLRTGAARRYRTLSSAHDDKQEIRRPRVAPVPTIVRPRVRLPSTLPGVPRAHTARESTLVRRIARGDSLFAVLQP